VGCRSVGPKTIPRDQFDYAESMRDAAKEQMLLNMVGLRYAEAPMFLKVTSVINQYSLEGSVSAAAPPYELQAAAAPPVGVRGRYADRPTVTYMPLTGAQFTRSVLTPLPPATIMSLIQAGWRADMLLRLAVRSINGVSSSTRIGDSEQDPRYFELVSLMYDLQRSGELSYRVEKRAEHDVSLIVIQAESSEEVKRNRRRLAEIIDIEPGLDEYRLVFGQTPSSRAEIAMLTKSILEMLVSLSLWVDVPPEHLASGRTPSSPRADDLEAFGFEPLIQVLSSDTRPNDAFVAVRYEGRWFWIEHDDFRSKRSLSFMQLMFSLAESGGGQQQPVVTVQAGGQ
jgi:hypothetical protein